jgi:hypothetical protein
MSAPATTDAKQSWRGAPRGALVRRSRNIWRWILSILSLVLIAVAIYWAWPRPLPRILMLVLTSDREERTLPLVPYVDGDRDALLEWARAAKVASCQRELSDVSTPQSLARQLAPAASAADRLTFALAGRRGGEYQISSGDTLVIYLKGHGLAIDVSTDEKPDIRPLLVKSLGESDLTGPWYRDEALTIDVAVWLRELSQLAEVRKVVILDAVHLNYDPRLGTLANAFPQAVLQAVEQLPKRSNLWVIMGQGDGELAVGLPGTGRSVLVDSLVKQLERQPGDAGTITIDALAGKVQARIDELAEEGKGSFKQTLQTAFAPGSGGGIVVLPTIKPPETRDAKSPPADSKVPATPTQPAKTVLSVPSNSGALAVLQQTAPAATNQLSTPATNPTASTTSPAIAAPTPTGGQPVSSAPAAAASVPVTGGPTVTPPSTEPPKTDLDLAWAARDRLRAKYRTGWSPVHVAPEQWRRIEGLLAGFDEEELCHEQPPRDRATLQLLRTGLEQLDAVFRGEQTTPAADDCRAIAEAFSRFSAGPAFRSFQSRQANGLDAANDALKVFAEGMCRAFDYVRLHGQMATVLDGGPLMNDAPLETLLDRLRQLRGLLNPVGLTSGRLNDARLRELANLSGEVESLRGRIDDELATYARTTAAAHASPGRLLRARLLLHSPLLPAELRQALRRPAVASPVAKREAPPPSSLAIGERLTRHARLSQMLLAVAKPAAAGTGPGPVAERATVTLLSRLSAVLNSANLKSDALSWPPLGRQFGEFASQLPAAIKRDHDARAAGQSDLSAPDMLDLYVAELLVDGRDARRAKDRTAPQVVLAQPLRPEAVTDRVDLAFSSPRLQLPGLGAEGATLQLTIQVKSDKLPPYSVALDLTWDENDLAVTRLDSGPAIRWGQNDLVLHGDESTVLSLRVAPRRESKEPVPTMVRARARFGSPSPTTAEVACSLPRPDQIDLTIAADDNLEAAKRRTWLSSSQQGGRLNLFPNRERSFYLYLSNLSSEEKRLHVRLYRVPPWAAGPAGRLWDPRALAQLLRAPAVLDGRLAQPGADAAAILPGLLIAQSNEKQPLVLPPSQVPVKTLLVPVPTATPPAAANAAQPAEKGEDVTDGLLLVLTSADGKGNSHVKWIELQMHQPDDLLEIREPAVRDGKLSFRVGLKDPALVEEMGLAKQPLAIAWDGQSLPVEVREATKELPIPAGDGPPAEFTALVSDRAVWPLFIQLQTDRDPRGLVSSFDRRGEQVVPINFKKDRAPVVHLSRLAATTQRSAGQPIKYQYLMRPPRAWMPFPSPAAVAEGLPFRDAGSPILVNVDPKSPSVRLEADLGADISPRYFIEGARVRLTVEQQERKYAADRQVQVRLTNVDAGGLQFQSKVSDFQRIEFDPIDVPQDKRVDVVAEVIGERLGPTSGETGREVVTLVLDRTPPIVNQVSGERADSPVPAVPEGLPQIKIVLRCHADDGNGSGIERVEFVIGVDSTSNGRLDIDERRPPVLGKGVANGMYEAECTLPPDLKSDQLLIEATATDQVGHTSAAATGSFALPRKVEGGQRTTYGKKKIEVEPPPAKKRP